MREREKVTQEEMFRSLPIPKALRIMILPAVTSQLIVLIYNMADTFYVGQTGNPYMVAATSLILPVFNISLCLAGLAGIGGGALIARLLGQGRQEEARRISAFSLYLGVLIAALFSVGMAAFMGPVLNLLGAGENTYQYARQYALCVIVAGGIPTVLSNVLANLIRSIGRSKEAGFGIILGGLLNIALDPLFMFVLLPRGYEVLGAGVATCLSNCIACLFFLVVVARMGSGSVITFNPRVGLAQRENLLSVFAVGIPSAVTTFRGKGLKIHRTRPFPEKNGQPGKAFSENGEFFVYCGQGAVQLLEVQAENGKRMAGKAFLLGHPLDEAAILG